MLTIKWQFHSSLPGTCFSITRDKHVCRFTLHSPCSCYSHSPIPFPEESTPCLPNVKSITSINLSSVEAVPRGVYPELPLRQSGGPRPSATVKRFPDPLPSVSGEYTRIHRRRALPTSSLQWNDPQNHQKQAIVSNTISTSSGGMILPETRAAVFEMPLTLRNIPSALRQNPTPLRTAK